LNPVRRLRADIPKGAFFTQPDPDCKKTGMLASGQWRDTAVYFGWWRLDLNGQPPDWHCNPMRAARVQGASREWWQIPDFDPQLGDVKTVWEASRFDWVLAMMQRTVCGERGELDRLNLWLDDWLLNNPPYHGPNWKCGQEASIRVMHLAAAALIGQQINDANDSLLDLIELHLRRIAPTLIYAVAQENNHGTSEAAALFIGGSWLVCCGRKQGARWERLGRRWLENRAARLIEPDGSFSQYSVNYHRVMLDTFSLVEVWRQKLCLQEFPDRLKRRVTAAARWMYAFVDPATGDAPNLGANDGARLIPLSDTAYRDFRPSVQLAMGLFAGERAFAGEGDWNQPLLWLDAPSIARTADPLRSEMFGCGGYAILRQSGAMAMLRFPRFRFRPSHADALHLDLWVDGENLLRDAGTLSYNTDSESLAYFPGTASHNTVQFDGRDQMPRLGRFLFGDWLTTNNVRGVDSVGNTERCEVAYRDGEGAQHARSVSMTADQLEVTDRIEGFRREAVLRWRLRPGEWSVCKGEASDGQHVIQITVDGKPALINLTEGWESRHYAQKMCLPVLEVTVHQSCTLETKYCWQ
jgi:hypothetical protein